MNKLVDKMINCLHWLDMFFPSKKDKVDWKDVGQMRARLVKMRFGDQVTSASKTIPIAQHNGSMLVNFRSMSSDRDKQSLSRWYKKECVVTREKQLSDRIVEGQRAHEARQTSGQYEAIKESEAENIYEVHQQEMSKEAEAKLADFLSGSTDDINELLFTSLANTGAVDGVESVAAKNEPPSVKKKDDRLASKFSRKRKVELDIISRDGETIAALEEAHKLDAYVSEENIVISPACAEPANLESGAVAEAAIDMYNGTDDELDNCMSLAAARNRKTSNSKSRVRRRK